MEVIICKTSDEASALAAKLLKNQIKTKPKSVLGLATGKTPLKLYKLWIALVKAEGVSLDHLTTFNLDEYVGVGQSHKGSYSYYLLKNIMEPLGLNSSQCHIPNGLAEDVAKECERYESLIHKLGPIDLQVLGLGRDGHIGFNEPGSSLGSRTRLKTLTTETREDNADLFSDSQETPRHVMTMGIQTILDSTQIIVMAFGDKKSQAVAQMLEGPICSFVPASALQMHPNVKVFLDEESASELKNTSYYKEVFSEKPAWQMKDFV